MSESLFPTANDKPPSPEKFTSDFSDDFACADSLAKKRWQPASNVQGAAATLRG